MNHNQTMDEFFHNFKELVDQLKCINLVLPEELFVILVLNSMPKSF